MDEAASRLAELMLRYQPDVVVTYDENGFYGHPDHIQANRITAAALSLTGMASKVYWTTAPRSTMKQFGEIMREFGADWEEPDPSEAGAGPEIGLPDEEITTWVDTTEFGSQKFDALAAHASQGRTSSSCGWARRGSLSSWAWRRSSGSTTPPARPCPRTTSSPAYVELRPAAVPRTHGEPQPAHAAPRAGSPRRTAPGRTPARSPTSSRGSPPPPVSRPSGCPPPARRGLRPVGAAHRGRPRRRHRPEPRLVRPSCHRTAREALRPDPPKRTRRRAVRTTRARPTSTASPRT